MQCFFRHPTVIIDRHNQIQIVPSTNLKVIWIVCRCDLYNARTKLHIHVFIGYNGNRLVLYRQYHHLAHNILVSLIIGVDSHSRVAKHRFGSCRCNNYTTIAVFKRIFNVIEFSLLLFVLNLQITQRRMTPWTPVDYVLVLVNQALFVELHKNLPNGLGELLIHRKAQARPVATQTQPLYLLNNPIAVFLFPFPNLLDEFFPSQILLLYALARQILFDHILRCDTGMVSARHPKDVIALHPLVSHHYVLQRAI